MALATPPASKVKLGTIKMFDERTGYGFIIPDDGGEEVFLHAQVCRRCGFMPDAGVRVEYEPVKAKQGLRACWVR